AVEPEPASPRFESAAPPVHPDYGRELSWDSAPVSEERTASSGHKPDWLVHAEPEGTEPASTPAGPLEVAPMASDAPSDAPSTPPGDFTSRPSLTLVTSEPVSYEPPHEAPAALESSAVSAEPPVVSESPSASEESAPPPEVSGKAAEESLK